MAIPKVAGVIVLTDCVPDTDAELRLSAQIMRLFGCGVQFGGIDPGLPGLRKAGNTLVSVLDAARLPTGVEPAGRLVKLVNAAERGAQPAGDDVSWDNGPPFGYFIDPDTDTLVVSTLNEELLAAAVAQGRLGELRVLHIPNVMKMAKDRLGVTPDEAEAIINTQFRSLWFQGLAAWLILAFGDDVEWEPYQLQPPPPAEGRVVRIDKFGHLITDVLVTQIPGFGPDSEVTIKLTNGNTVPCYWRLADAPDGELVAIRSSAGYRDRLHLMLSVRGLQHLSASRRVANVLGRQVIDMSSIG
jgi:hypothetical protein